MNIRQHTAQQYREVRKLLRANPPIEEDIPPAAWQKACDIAHDLIILIVFAIAIWLMCFLLVGKAHGQDKCQDPGLRPELKKACYQMEKVCDEIGCSVSIR